VESTYVQEFEITGGDFLRAGQVSTQIKATLKEIGINHSIVRRIAICAYEAEMNVFMYARRGKILFSVNPEEVQITIEDEGKGIEDIEKAMQEGYSTATPEIREMGFGAGMGLPNIKKNADTFQISSVVEKGTKLQIGVKIQP